MAGLPPGDPQLVSMIVGHLKTQGLFDQFRRDCLADVDTKPAYLNLKQRVDNFVSNHLSNHTWSPHLNKNQLRNNIRQLVLQSGMLEQGVDRIVAQVVDPKVNHLFRPQVERVVREFLSPGSYSEEPPLPLPSTETKPDVSDPEQASTSAPATTSAGDAMSILDTITSLNQEASVRAGSDKGRRGPDELALPAEDGEMDMSVDEEGDGHHDGRTLEEAREPAAEVQALEVKTEDTQEHMDLGKEALMEEVKMEEEEESGAQEQTEEERESAASKTTGRPAEEKRDDDDGGDGDDVLTSTSQAKQKDRERIKEEYLLEDSDLDGLSDITVSSVHTSDLSSLEEQSEDDELLSDSSEEGELQSDDQDEGAEKREAGGDAEEEERKPRRKAYVHKPFLYSRYYSDSDDEITVEERRRSAAKDKEERLLKRQQNRERMEEKRKQKAAQAEEQDQRKQKGGASLEGPRAKEARKERKVLEKKMALNRKRKLDSRKDGDAPSRRRGDAEGPKKAEVKSAALKPPQPKCLRILSECASSDERPRRTSGSASEDSSEPKRLCDKSRTHSFILELEQGSQEALKQRSVGKFDRFSRKELHLKERKEKERSASDERAKAKQKQEKKCEHQADEAQQKEGAAVKGTPEEKGEKKLKIKSEKKMAPTTREGKPPLSEGVADEGPKDASGKKSRAASVEAVKADKDRSREKEKDKSKEKEKAKGERTSARSDQKQLLRVDSACSSEDMEPDSSKKKEKLSKEPLKRSKSHGEDRPKSKSDNKDGEKEKTKADQDGQKPVKSSSETETKRAKTSDRARTVERARSKSKEETKTLLSRTDSKAPSACKPEKKVNAKEQRGCEEPLQELKSGKKKAEKKDKVPEKKDVRTEETKTPPEDTPEKSLLSSPDEEEQPQKGSFLRDAGTDSDPVAASDDPRDALSDALSDAPPEPPADALLALMDVCTSAGARLPPGSTLQEADLKMKEAALTLLSMDPESTVSSTTGRRGNHGPPGRMQTDGAEPGEPPADEVTASGDEPSAADPSNSEEEVGTEETSEQQEDITSAENES
uniref:biorientation of chromosomes in cell division protein 1-like 1 isoform X3 n=1 Tax=Gasterosteus aculeatus aculeatus TaxID=481459 RepID=UPI001A97D3CD|nr:biorientation of chromosomes in cell division protein 1-like 1 isoform X3 [Gasterosteus aculeatus aculeatus]XP_040028659.1 biorientation of chromosomes in cell division protein 1-like 1 isoform X3 [Gasterosteus aculeatus aculeatus]